MKAGYSSRKATKFQSATIAAEQFDWLEFSIALGQPVVRLVALPLASLLLDLSVSLAASVLRAVRRSREAAHFGFGCHHVWSHNHEQTLVDHAWHFSLHA